MASLNRVSLLGRVGQDPDIKYSAKNTDEVVANFSLATGGDKYTDKDGQQQVTETQWHRCVAFKGLAKVIEIYVSKGSQIYIDGKLKYEKYTSKDGVEKTATKIILDNLILCGSKNDNNTNSTNNNISNNYIQTTQNNNNFESEDVDFDSPNNIPF